MCRQRASRSGSAGGVESPLVKGEVYRTTDGTAGEVRSVRPLDRVRLTWQPPGRPRDATLQVALSAAKGGCTVHFHVDRLENVARGPGLTMVSVTGRRTAMRSHPPSSSASAPSGALELDQQLAARDPRRLSGLRAVVLERHREGLAGHVGLVRPHGVEQLRLTAEGECDAVLDREPR